MMSDPAILALVSLLLPAVSFLILAIVAPFRNGRDQVIGAIGVVGPTRINYARIIPVVDYTAKVITRLIS